MIEVVYTLHMEIQQELLRLCRRIVQQAPLFQKTMPTGAKFRYLCTSAGAYGWLSDSKGFRYETHHPETGRAFPPIPDLMREIAIDAAAQYALDIRPESALINWYEADSKLGLHQDKRKKRRSRHQYQSGDLCMFTVGGETRSAKKHDVTLASGDVLVMGAEHRYIFHGVKKIVPGTAPAELGMKTSGRVNITIRQVIPETKGIRMTTHDYMIDIINAVSEWEGVEVHAYLIGGREFKLGNVEIGHVHRGGMLDIPYPKRIHDVLLREGKTGAHHILPESGWTTFYTRTESDLHQAIWLLRLSYIQKAWRRLPELRADLQHLLDDLNPGDELRALIDSHSA